MPKRIAQVVVGLPVEGPFDYLADKAASQQMIIGGRVRVPFGQRQLVGFIVGLSKKSKLKKLKFIQTVIDNQPVIDNNLLKLTHQFASYYCCSWGVAIEASLPSLLRKGRSIELPPTSKFNNKKRLAKINEAILLHDQGRQKKWPILLEHINKTKAKGQGVIFLVPEVALIRHIKKRLEESVSCEVAVLDKKLTANQELETWSKVKSGQIKIVIGTRSAIFAPVKDLGLIIVYDENNTAYKQEQSPHYHARKVALMRSNTDQCSLIFVSPTPSAEIWWMAQRKKMKLISLISERKSTMHIVNMLNYNFRKSSILSVPLRNSMQSTLEAGGRVVLFMNRRGFSTSTSCNNCGYVLSCERCNVNMTYLYEKKKMICRHCNSTKAPPKICPNCKSSYLRYKGMGIEKLESEVARIFPQANVSHYDKDSKTIPKDADVIIATQAILKWQDEFSVNLVGILQLDTELNRLDFRSGHKVFSLLNSLRQLASEKLIVQTRLPDNYSICAARDMDFKKFYRKEIKLRRELGFPPFRHLITIMLRGPREENVFRGADSLYKELCSKDVNKNIEILEPQADIIPKLRGKYRFMVIVKAKFVAKAIPLIQGAIRALKKKSSIITTVDID